MNSQMKKMYEGKAKALYRTQVEDEVLVVYSDQATAFNGEKKEQIAGKGALNNQISALIFAYLNRQGLPTQFVKKVDETKQIVKKLTMLPIEVVVRNCVAGSFAKRFGLKEGSVLGHPVVELFLKNDDLGDPFVNASQLSALNLLSPQQSDEAGQFALVINEKLSILFDSIGVSLVDIKFEFGVDKDGKLILADEISPDTCRLWDKHTRQKLDKDNFRLNLGNIIPVYEEVYRRLQQKLK